MKTRRKIIKKNLLFILVSLFLMSCGTSESVLQTAMFETELAKPTTTNTIIPTDTPTVTPSLTPTFTLTPSKTPIATSSPTETETPTKTPLPEEVITQTEATYKTLILEQVIAEWLNELAVMLQNDEISGFEAGMIRLAIAAMFSGLDEAIQEGEPVDFLSAQWSKMLDIHEAIRDIMLRWFDEEIDSSNVVVEMPSILKNIDTILSDSEGIISDEYGIDKKILSDAREEVLEVVKDFKNEMQP